MLPSDMPHHKTLCSASAASHHDDLNYMHYTWHKGIWVEWLTPCSNRFNTKYTLNRNLQGHYSEYGHNDATDVCLPLLTTGCQSSILQTVTLLRNCDCNNQTSEIGVLSTYLLILASQKRM
jgi:hypothetical protein